MRRIRVFLRFWYDFIVGDDWRLAIGVSLSIALTFMATHAGANWWWALPAAVAALLVASVHHAVRSSADRQPLPPGSGPSPGESMESSDITRSREISSHVDRPTQAREAEHLVGD